MNRTRLLPWITLVTLALAACAPQQSAGSAAVTQTAVIPTLTIPPPPATGTPVPSPTATLAPLPTATATPQAVLQPTGTIAPTGTIEPTGSTASGVSANPLDCASFNDPNVKITIPDSVGPYKIFCAGVYGGLGVEIVALGADNKMATTATFATPVKACFKGRGKVVFMDTFGGSFASTNLTTTQEDAFTCAPVTKPGSVMFAPG